MSTVTVADTAFSIAVVREEESLLPEAERLFEDPFAHVFTRHGAHAKEATERYLALPMFREGIRLRTRFIDDATREGIGAGLRQVVILGAGFDARGLRMTEIAETGTKVFEVDVSSQIARKRAWLAEAKVEVPDRVRFVSFDFAPDDFEDALIAALEKSGFVVGGGAIVIWEGVLGYIDDAAIERSLRFVARAGGPGTRLVFTAHEGAFAPESAHARMTRHGFASCEEVGLDVVWRRWLATDPHPYAKISRLGVAIR